jgi:hypothetical protein
MPIEVAASLTRRTLLRTAATALTAYPSLTGRRTEATAVAQDEGLRIRGVVMVPETLTLESLHNTRPGW